jgi:hypothetical protein
MGRLKNKILKWHQLYLKDAAINLRSKVMKRMLVQIESFIAESEANKAILSKIVGSKKKQELETSRIQDAKQNG